MAVFEQHCKMAQEYLKVQTEIALLIQRKYVELHEASSSHSVLTKDAIWCQRIFQIQLSIRFVNKNRLYSLKMSIQI